MTPYSAEAEIEINVPAAKVWDALTNPGLVKQYLFGTTVKSEWKVGSPITYTGVWECKEYEDKGIILKMENEKLFSSSYWSSFSGVPDEPENYQIVTYKLAPSNGGTRLTLLQENAPSKESAEHAKQNWTMVLGKMKEVLEK